MSEQIITVGLGGTHRPCVGDVLVVTSDNLSPYPYVIDRDTRQRVHLLAGDRVLMCNIPRVLCEVHAVSRQERAVFVSHYGYLYLCISANNEISSLYNYTRTETFCLRVLQVT